MKKKLLLALFALLTAGLLVYIVSGCGSSSDAVAWVNGQPITKDDLTKEVKYRFGSDAGDPSSAQFASYEKQMVEVLVATKVLDAEAQKMNITASDDEVNQAIDQQKQALGGDDKLQQRLSDSGVSQDEFQAKTRDDIIFQKVIQQVTQNVSQVTDQQAQDYFNNNLQQFETRNVRHILVADQATAQSIKNQLDAGADFTALAKQYSTDTSTKDKGGDLGGLHSIGSGMVPEFEQAMDQLAAGQTSGPVHTQYGWHIIRVDSVTPADQNTFTQMKDNIKQGMMLENQRAAFDKWLNDTEKNYDIKYADGYDPNTNTAPVAAAGAGATP